MFKKRRPLYFSAGANFQTDWMTTRDITFVARKYKSASAGKNYCGKRVYKFITREAYGAKIDGLFWNMSLPREMALVNFLLINKLERFVS